MLPGKTLTPADALVIVRRRIWLVVLPPIVTFFFALMYSSRVPNLYESDMLIAIDPQRVPDEFVRSTVTLETDRRLDALQVKVLSRTNLEKMIETFDLYRDKKQRLPMELVVEEMREDISVTRERVRTRGEQEATAFHVRFMYDDPEMAAAVTQRMGALFVEQNVEDRSSVAGATNRFLEDQLKEARTKLEDQERRLEAFRQQHGQELPTQTQANMQALSSTQLQAQSLVESLARDRDRKQMLERLYREADNEPAIVTEAPAANGGTAVSGSARQQLAPARARPADPGHGDPPSPMPETRARWWSCRRPSRPVASACGRWPRRSKAWTGRSRSRSRKRTVCAARSPNTSAASRPCRDWSPTG